MYEQLNVTGERLLECYLRDNTFKMCIDMSYKDGKTWEQALETYALVSVEMRKKENDRLITGMAYRPYADRFDLD